MNAINEPATFGDFAAWVGVSPAAASDLAARGVIAAGQPLREMVRAYSVHLRAVAAGRAATGNLDLAGERAGLARAQRERTELLTLELRGELVRRVAVERELAARLVALRENLDALGDRLGPLLAAEDRPGNCRRLVRDEIRASLSAFALALSAQHSTEADNA